MKISARKKLGGRVESVKVGAVNTVVRRRLTATPVVAAVITHEAAEELGLAEGAEACAVVKASDVMIGLCHDGAGSDPGQ